MAKTDDMKRITPSYRPAQSPSAAPCQEGCANCGDIRGWIGIVAQRAQTGMSPGQAFAQAWEKIIDVNPFPATLGRICPHPCESQCNRAAKDDALAINAMERFLGDYGIRKELALPGASTEVPDVSIGVVGAGPSGLSFAYQMRRRGYRVTIYDAREKPGGMLRYGIPDYRLPPDVLDAEIKKILDLGVRLKCNTRIGRDISLHELRERHDCLYLGIGAQRGGRLNLPGMQGQGVLTAVEYLGRVNAGESVDLGSHVVVVGGGNSAMDAARTARRQGAAVTVLYRRTMADMPASTAEIEEAVEEDVKLVLLAAPVRAERDNNGNLAAVQAERMQLGELDASGRGRPMAIPGSEFRIEATALVSAVSQRPELAGFEELESDQGWLISGQQGEIGDGLFSGGDSTGAGIAGSAIVQGRFAAERLHADLSGAPPETAGVRADNGSAANRILADTKPLQNAVKPTRVSGDERLLDPASEVNATITEAQFLQEVERCFSCGSCFGCERCSMYCTAGCFTRLEEIGPGQYFSLSLDSCRECGKCVEICPCGYLKTT